LDRNNFANRIGLASFIIQPTICGSAGNFNDDMPGASGPALDAFYARGAAWLRGEKLG
jgi:hypothetical protein